MMTVVWISLFSGGMAVLVLLCALAFARAEPERRELDRAVGELKAAVLAELLRLLHRIRRRPAAPVVRKEPEA